MTFLSKIVFSVCTIVELASINTLLSSNGKFTTAFVNVVAIIEYG